MSRMAKYVMIAAVAFAMGGALAWVQNKYAPEKEVVSEQAVPSAEPLAAPETKDSTVGTVVANAPPMPDASDADAQPVSIDAPVAAAPAGDPGHVVAGPSVGGSFTLTDHLGQTVTEKSWPGKKLLVFFGFTRCPDECPAGLQKISAVMDAYDANGDKIQPLFITVDPARDTQEVVVAYLKSFNSHIVGLTGTKEQIEAAEKAYKVYAAEHEGMMEHSAFIYLMSEDNQLLDAIDSKSTVDDMVAGIKAHLETAPQ